MTLSINDIEPFDVLIASVRFEDKPDVSKPRPVIALEMQDDRLLVTAVKVTSRAPREDCPGEVVLEDWFQEGLVKPSVARCSKIVLLRISDIKGRCGALSSRDKFRVVAGLMA